MESPYLYLPYENLTYGAYDIRDDEKTMDTYPEVSVEVAILCAAQPVHELTADLWNCEMV